MLQAESDQSWQVSIQLQESNLRLFFSYNILLSSTIHPFTPCWWKVLLVQLTCPVSCGSQDTSIMLCGIGSMYYLVPININSLPIAVRSCHFCNSFKGLPNSALQGLHHSPPKLFTATAWARSATDMCNPTMPESCFDSTKCFQISLN